MFFNDTATTEIYTLPLHDALTILGERALPLAWRVKKTHGAIGFREQRAALATVAALLPEGARPTLDRKSTRLNSSHANISYAVFCLKNNHSLEEPLTAPLLVTLVV